MAMPRPAALLAKFGLSLEIAIFAPFRTLRTIGPISANLRKRPAAFAPQTCTWNSMIYVMKIRCHSCRLYLVTLKKQTNKQILQCVSATRLVSSSALSSEVRGSSSMTVTHVTWKALWAASGFPEYGWWKSTVFVSRPFSEACSGLFSYDKFWDRRVHCFTWLIKNEVQT